MKYSTSFLWSAIGALSLAIANLMGCHNDSTGLFWVCGVGVIIGGMMAGYDLARWIAAKEDGL